ncbi:MAG TPA: hypothetical protein VKG86_01130 [Terracidiphilus sp.]|nr:hypothetical protein [Terracidiphilus sp.]
MVRSEGRKYSTDEKILNAEGAALAECKGLFIEVCARLLEIGAARRPPARD